ncbi:MAG: hypothetical protein LBB34_02730 [Holosporales bacterium]|jgi:hypothetical protein|nr:hypothetical protein [Holosporales bacterium]
MKQCLFLFCLLACTFSCQCADFDVDDIKVGCDCNSETQNGWQVEKIDENWMEKLKIPPPEMIAQEQVEE